MKKWLIAAFVVSLFLLISPAADAQCSLCTKTASQLGEKPALGMNQGILYLMFTPLIIIGFLAYRWWKFNKEP
ncbi:MAG TPA: hypothetical protein DCQ34_00915 [Chitinophagaceae bacterium]|nr:hypothetical protein [Chitinophagaceae bacterium]HRF26937.1 hypothetical protein [Ferruginibacter sp.]